MAILGVNYQTFDGGLLYKGNLKTKNGCPAKIVVHNSACAAGAFATANYNKFETESGKRTAFAHYYCDDKNVIQLARENWIAYHCGNKEINAMSIGIEICVNPMGCFDVCQRTNCRKSCINLQSEGVKKFFKAERIAIDLIHTIMSKWGLDESCLLFHSDVKKTDCPYFTKKLHDLVKARDFLTIFGS